MIGARYVVVNAAKKIKQDCKKLFRQASKPPDMSSRHIILPACEKIVDELKIVHVKESPLPDKEAVLNGFNNKFSAPTTIFKPDIFLECIYPVKLEIDLQKLCRMEPDVADTVQNGNLVLQRAEKSEHKIG